MNKLKDSTRGFSGWFGLVSRSHVTGGLVWCLEVTWVVVVWLGVDKSRDWWFGLVSISHVTVVVWYGV